MSESKGVGAASILIGMLLCIVLTQAACAQSEGIDAEATCGNVTVHSINPSSHYVYLVAGTNESFTVSFTNEGDEQLNVTPRLVYLPYMTNKINESWITVSPTNATVNPSSVQEFTTEINVPKDARGGYYQTGIAFADNITFCTEENPDPQYVNVLSLDVTVEVPPKLELQTGYISDALQAGREYTYTIKMKNVADKDITIDPKITRDTVIIYEGSSQAFADDIIEISAPSTIQAGRVAIMTIRIPVPENATGTYNGYIDMNVDGETNDGFSPQLGMDFRIWQQPSVPYAKTFNTTTTDPITIEVSTDTYESNPGLRSPGKDEPSFQVKLNRNSSPVNMTLVNTAQSGSVGVGGYYYPTWAMDNDTIYQDYGTHYVETYMVPGAIGDWELFILPKNTENFWYSVTIGDSSKKQE